MEACVYSGVVLLVRGMVLRASSTRGIPVQVLVVGQDPYWGRLASELGSAGIKFSPESISVSYGGVTVADGGVTIDHDAAAVAAHMAQRNLEIVCDLGIGTGSFTVLTNDLTHEYIDENTGGS